MINSAPKHLAIIMDGNGRWASLKGKPRSFGHIKGSRVARNIIESCVEHGIKYLTLFAFSTENWMRPKKEVNFLMKLLRKKVVQERKNMIKNNIKLICIGDRSKIPKNLMDEIKFVENKTKDNDGLTLVIALSYGGRQEILEACKNICREVMSDTVKIDNLNEDIFSSYLETKNIPDPDLVIRTSGETRLSNFLMWQMAYSEIYFSKVLWPNFSNEDFNDALRFYNKKQRRFGRTSDQLSLVVRS